MATRKTKTHYAADVRERAVRMVSEQRKDYPSRWATIVAVAGEIGSTPQTLDNWTKQVEQGVPVNKTGRAVAKRLLGVKGDRLADEGEMLDRRELTDEDRERLKALERENRELRHANALLRKQSVHKAEEIPDSEPNRREKIILIASRMFLSKGFSATSMDEIAEAAGTTGPALYRFFESKQDILDSLCVIGSEKKVQGVQHAIEQGDDDSRETLRHLVKNRILFAFGPWGCQVPISDAESKHLSSAARIKVETDAEINRAEWFKYLNRIRPQMPTRVTLSIIHAVIMEITYVGHHISELHLEGDIQPILQRLAWTGLMS